MSAGSASTAMESGLQQGAAEVVNRRGFAYENQGHICLHLPPATLVEIDMQYLVVEDVPLTFRTRQVAPPFALDTSERMAFRSSSSVCARVSVSTSTD
jgi:hypothetical protein